MLTNYVHGELGNTSRQTQMQRRKLLYRVSMKKRADDLVSAVWIFENKNCVSNSLNFLLSRQLLWTWTHIPQFVAFVLHCCRFSMKKRPDGLVITEVSYDVLNCWIGALDFCLFSDQFFIITQPAGNIPKLIRRSPSLLCTYTALHFRCTAADAAAAEAARVAARTLRTRQLLGKKNTVANMLHFVTNMHCPALRTTDHDIVPKGLSRICSSSTTEHAIVFTYTIDNVQD